MTLAEASEAIRLARRQSPAQATGEASSIVLSLENALRRTSLRACNAAMSTAIRLADMSAALDGYPASSLVDYCIDAIDVEGATLARRQWLVAHILTQWSDQLARDIEGFPSSELDSFEAIRQRMIRARDALLAVRSLLLGLGHMAELRAAAADAPPAPKLEAGRPPKWPPRQRPQPGL
jgi:hypothetical protein